MTLIASVPIILALALLVGLRLPAITAMPICAAATAFIAYSLWKVPLLHIAAASVEAGFLTVAILQIIFGALFYLWCLRLSGGMSVLQNKISSLSDDIRIQVVLVAWLLGSFLEGAAGFGTPAAITAPLLISLGFQPLLAVVAALVGDSTAVSFGAVGTPMIFGLGQGIGGIQGAPELQAVVSAVALNDLVLGTLMPALLVMVVVLSENGFQGWEKGVSALPFACSVGFVQAASSCLVALTLGAEFPSLVGPAAGFIFAVFLIRNQIFIPKRTWLTRRQEKTELPDTTNLSTRAALIPHLLLFVLLILTRVKLLPTADFLATYRVTTNNIFGSNISAELVPFYSPGTIFIATALLSIPILRIRSSTLTNVVSQAGITTLKTSLALLSSLIVVRIFLQSGVNSSGFAPMPMVLAGGLVNWLGVSWPFFAPWLGALGSFISGSATFSNLLFGAVQLKVSNDLNLPTAFILSLQSIGSAAGNMSCIHNVVAACAVGGITGKEGAVIRRTALPMMVYLFCAGAIGLLCVLIR